MMQESCFAHMELSKMIDKHARYILEIYFFLTFNCQTERHIYTYDFEETHSLSVKIDQIQTCMMLHMLST